MGFEFVTDFVGGGEMGYWEGPGLWNHPDPVEYVRIRGEQLVAVNGRLQLRVTNELEEVLYVDQLQLMAVAHPADVQVFPNEGMTVTPKAHRLHGVRQPHAPVRVTDEPDERTPQLLLFAGGDTTPYRLTLRRAGGATLRIAGDADGTMEIRDAGSGDPRQ